jgi:hypothetical protein
MIMVNRVNQSQIDSAAKLYDEVVSGVDQV